MDSVGSGKLKDKHREAWTATLNSVLYPGEQLVALVRVNLLRPMCDGLAVTNARILAFQSRDLASKGCKLEVLVDDLVEVDVSRRRGSDYIVAHTRRDDGEVVFGAVHKLDGDLVLTAARQLITAGMPSSVRSAIEAQAADTAADQERWQQVEVIGDPLSDKAQRTLREHAAPDETPWFVVSSGAGGVLAAFADRCMIVKVGALTSIMAGSLGGGRITTFPYSEVTGIEYNAGIVNGVLEILTPSYQSTANKDYWQGIGKSPNADTNDPWTLSNTLPLAKVLYQRALPRLNELRARIAEAKRPTVVVQSAPVAPPAVQNDLVGELTRLGALHQQGLLTDTEFAAAKQAVIAQRG